MKKLIMLLMCFVLCSVAVADDLDPPDWAGAPGTIYGVWGFGVDAPSGDAGWPDDYPEEGLMTSHDFNPDPEEFGETSDTEGAHQYMINLWAGGEEEESVWHDEHNDYPGRQGILEVMMMSFDMYNFAGDGTKLIRLQVTWAGTKPPELGWGWEPPETEDSGAWDAYVVNEIVIDENWTHTTLEVEIDSNPEFEFIEFGFDSITYIDQVVIDTICYDGESLPVGTPRAGGAVKTEIVYDPNITTIYEPQDPEEFGPPPPGPVVGNFGVKLGWRPGEDPCNLGTYFKHVEVTITLDPNTEGDKDHDDYFIWGGDPVDGTITLVFDANNYDILQKVNIEAIKDLDREGNETYTLGFTSACLQDPNFDNDPCSPVTQTLSITVIDNDVRHVSALPTRITLSETDAGDPCGTKEIEVRLSHPPSDTVYVLVWGDEWAFEEEMFIIDPNFEDWMPLYGEPNRLTFTATTWGGGSCPEYNETTMTSCWNKPLTIQVHAKDNDWVTEPDVTNIGGLVVFTPYSEDLEYCVDWLEADPYGFPLEVTDSGGIAEEAEVTVVVEDDDCGAKGYDIADINEDCVVNLGDLAVFFNQWLSCTQPYDDDGVCGRLWNLGGEEEEEEEEE